MNIDSFRLHKAAVELEDFKKLLIQSQDLGIDTSQFVSKIDSVIMSLKNQTIKVVLLGSFSDGKTSAIAGLMGQLKDNMKIDQDESSDELAIYHFDGISNLEIIDTPGLFGTKEKEVDGVNIKFSEITKRFISEANIIIYVCDAVTPLKESHVEIIRRVLRDYGKLKHTVFVLNKMDEAGYDLLDPEDFNRGAIIKRETLVRRLKDTMSLTDDEEEQLHIVCIAADPKGKGLEHWFTKMDSYKERSHINLLNESITEIVESSDIIELKSDTNLAVINDVVTNVSEQISTKVIPIENAVRVIKTNSDELILDKNGLRRELIAAKGRLLDDLAILSSSIITEINNTDQTSLSDIIETKLGIVDGQVDYHILDAKIEQAISQCVESNNHVISSKVEEFSQKVSIQEKILNDTLKFGVDKLGKVRLSNQDVLKARDFLAKHFDWAKKIKFKPHGAGKLASKATKLANRGAIFIKIGLDLREYIKDKKKEEEFQNLKLSLKSDVSAKFKDLYESLNSDDQYFKEYAPSYLELCDTIEIKKNELDILQNRIQQLCSYNDQIKGWLLYNQK